MLRDSPDPLGVLPLAPWFCHAACPGIALTLYRGEWEGLVWAGGHLCLCWAQGRGSIGGLRPSS